MSLIEGIVYFSFGLVLYSYLFYPGLLLLVSGGRQLTRDIRYVLQGGSRRVVDQELPTVSVVISAYNEEACIRARIENLLSVDYPEDKIQFLIGSDGSQDNTSKEVSEIDDPRLVFYDFKENRGKSSVLNDLVSKSDSEIIVLSDANTDFETNAIKKLVRHFSSEKVGAVCGELRLVESGSGENLDGVYWKYERILKFFESRLGALVGANGAIYAIRRSEYKPIPSDTIVDDFTIAINVSLNKKAVVYDPEAIAVEEVAPSCGDEFKRRVRIGSGNFQVLHRFPNLLNPFKGYLAWVYISHKALRWLAPMALLIALIGSLVLAFNSAGYFAFFVLQLFTYILSYRLRNSTIQNKLIRLVVFWVNMNIALGLGAHRYYRGKAKGTWSSTNR